MRKQVLAALCAGFAFVEASAAADYRFATLYSDLAVLVPVRELAGDPRDVAPAAPRPRVAFPKRRPDWQDTLPWWRERVLDDGPPAPFDRESRFNRSLEAGRAYYERTQSDREAGGRDAARAGPGAPVPPLVAAIILNEAAPQAMPSVAAAFGPIVVYKGATLVGAPYPGTANDPFFAAARRAVDMTEELPDALRRLARKIDRIVYDPPSPHRVARGAAVDFDGVYAIADIERTAPLILRRDVRSTSSLRIAQSLVAAGVLAARHERLTALMKDRDSAGTDDARARREREIADRLAAVGDTDPVALNAAECELQLVLHRSDRALGLGRKDIGARIELLRQRSCGLPP